MFMRTRCWRPAGRVAAALFFFAAANLRAADSAPPGLAVTFTAGGASDTMIAPDVALFVGAGQPPTPFLAGGKFTAVWQGALSAELRGNFFFQAELNGALTVEINGALALDFSGSGASPLSKAVRLNKGANALKAVFTSPAKGDAFVRLAWTEKGTNTSPIPLTAWSHAATAELSRGEEARRGRELFLEHRCVRCHAGVVTTPAPELSLDAPTFEGIGARRHFAWMAEWILDPQSLRPAAQMPRVLRGPAAKEDAAVKPRRQSLRLICCRQRNSR